MTEQTLQEQLLADLFHPSASRSPRESAAMMEIIDLRKKVAELEEKALGGAKQSKTEGGQSRSRAKRDEVAEESNP
jgi:hypothetical protein